MKMLFALVLALGTFGAQAETYVYDYGTDYQVMVTTLANLSVGQPARRYSVRVRNCADTVGSVMLRVSDAGLQVSGAGVIYTDGTVEAYSLNHTFPAGYDSPWISIDSFKEAGKCVKSVFVDAQSSDPRIKSRVKVFGN
jgi:hypothetical protein